MFAICRTPGCANQDVPIDVGPTNLVICGPCGRPTDLSATKPRRKKEAGK